MLSGDDKQRLRRWLPDVKVSGRNACRSNGLTFGFLPDVDEAIAVPQLQHSARPTSYIALVNRRDNRKYELRNDLAWPPAGQNFCA
jgi:hypothetical protein